MTDDIILTYHPILYQVYFNRANVANLPYRPLKLGRLIIVLPETRLWLRKKFVPMATRSFPVPTHLI